MAYITSELKEKAISAITKGNLIFVEDVCALIGIAKSTYYEHFPPNQNDSNELTKLLEKNKITLKVTLRKKWLESDNPTTQMALYKLCSTDIEHKKLQQNYTDITSDNEKINNIDPFAQIRQNVGINDKADTSD